jgi:simple sugar transport system ATP-binding protein
MRVELQDIHKYFGEVRANDGISLVFEPGRIYGLLGENGAGKSTLMKILSGYQAPTSGTILLDGRAMQFASPSDALASGIGMLYQDPLDFPPMQVVENHLLAHDTRLILDRHTASQEVGSYASSFGFELDPRTYVDSMTLGERQQMELLRLLALGAGLLILDEPTTGISAEQKEMLFGTMRRLAHEEQKTIILVSHKLEEVQELCDEVAILRHGKLVGIQAIPCPTVELVRMMFGEEIPRSERAPRAEVPVVLKVEDVTIRTYRLSVEHIDLELRGGEVLGLAGLEGSGQRLLLQACAGLIPIRSGKILLDGEPAAGKRSPFFWASWLAWVFLAVRAIWLATDRAQGRINSLQLAGGIVVALLIAGAVGLAATVLVAWTSQSAYHAFRERGGAYVSAGRLEEGLVSGLSLTEHMALVSPASGFLINWRRARDEIAARIGYYNVIGRPETKVDELSGGNQQRTMLALLEQSLRLILLEHPTRGLDVTSANHIWGLFQQRLQQGTAIMFISADLDELLERSDHIAVFSGGVMSRIVSAGETSVEELGRLIGGQQL